jgi:hypothetical protein
MFTKSWWAARWLDLRSHLPGHLPEPNPLDGLPPADADDPPEVTDAREAWVNAQLALIAAYDRNDRLAVTAARWAVDDTRIALEAAKARHGIEH